MKQNLASLLPIRKLDKNFLAGSEIKAIRVANDSCLKSRTEVEKFWERNGKILTEKLTPIKKEEQWHSDFAVDKGKN